MQYRWSVYSLLSFKTIDEITVKLDEQEYTIQFIWIEEVDLTSIDFLHYAQSTLQ